MPLAKTEEEMSGEGWYKELTIKKVKVVNGICYCEEFDFFADALPCTVRDGGTGPPCGTEHVYLKCQSGKLLWCCYKHRTAQGPLTFNVGSKAKEYQISPTEAIDICVETGQEIEDQLRAMASTEKSRTSGIPTRRRPKTLVG